MIARALGRLLLVPLALLLGVLAAAAVLVTLGLEVTTHALSAGPDDSARLDILMDLGFNALTIAAASSILPALLLAIVGEIARVRSALYYVAAGGISLALLPLVTRLGMDHGSIADVPTQAWTVLATAGFAGGLVYWLIAGRTA